MAGIKSASTHNLDKIKYHLSIILLFLVLRNSCTGITGTAVKKETRIIDIKDTVAGKVRTGWKKNLGNGILHKAKNIIYTITSKG